jgi:hypothetical protein
VRFAPEPLSVPCNGFEVMVKVSEPPSRSEPVRVSGFGVSSSVVTAWLSATGSLSRIVRVALACAPVAAPPLSGVSVRLDVSAGSVKESSLIRKVTNLSAPSPASQATNKSLFRRVR